MLNVSQPSVSRLIADLERAVGFRLFDRRGARVHPTEQAQMLFEAVRRSYTGLDLLDQAARRIARIPSARCGLPRWRRSRCRSFRR
jgi:DNA-binding transcriptional LysR family regulator